MNDRPKGDDWRKSLMRAFAVLAGVPPGAPGKRREEAVRKAEQVLTEAPPRALVASFRDWCHGSMLRSDPGPDPVETNEKSAPPEHRRMARNF